MIDYILNSVSWWWYAIALAILAAITFNVWWPIFISLPWSAIITIVVAIGSALAYIAGRNKGSSTALEGAEKKEKDLAENIVDRGNKARANSERDAITGRLHDDDGWKRPNG